MNTVVRENFAHTHAAAGPQTAAGRQRRAEPITNRVRRDGKFFRLGQAKFYVKGMTYGPFEPDRSGDPLALLLVDIDNFKWLNDRHGHAIGDEVLSRVATILTHAVRETDLVARYGGEEFAVLAPRTDVKGAMTLAERMRQDVAEARFRGLEGEASGRLAVTVSVGVALYHGDPKRFFTEADRARLMADAGIIRSNGKIDAAISGARIYLDMRERGEDFGTFLWDMVGGAPIQNQWRAGEVPAETPLAVQMSKALKAKGFKFCGPVIVYAFMQATGLVNDHLVTCFRHQECKALGHRS